MCSIAGYFSNKPLKKETSKRLASALLYFGKQRGEQSAGAFIVNDTELKMQKRAVNPSMFIASKTFNLLFDKGAKVALLHTRFPTCGAKTDKQAQPFIRPDTATVHNGYYFDIAGIRDKWGLTKKSGVDSELITDFIEDYGINMLSQFLASTDGPSAIAAYHKGRLYLARGDNPLHYCPIDIDGRKVLVFASTHEQLESALQHTVLCEHFDIRELKENRVYLVGVKQIKKIARWKNETQHYMRKWSKKKTVEFDMEDLIDEYSVTPGDDPKDLVDIMEDNALDYWDKNDFFLNQRH